MKKILLLLADGFEAVEASVFTDVLGWNKWEGDGSTEVITAGLRDKLTCTWNFTVIPEKTIDNIQLDEFDALAIPGGFEEAGFYRDAFSKEFLHVIRHFHVKQKPIASICVASLALGKSGILIDKKATTYSHPTSKRKEQLKNFGAKVQNDLIVQDGNIITSSNPGTAFDVAFLLLEKLTSKQNAKHVKNLMGF
ncbi:MULTISPECIES: DJ-1/PfpI family protein [Bacillus cereus group]|uniref:ThiJ/PfpI domain protein n=2 Tax=Bacillus cereus group TaxID=86661 RepID=A0A1C4D254_BACTU|nr:MULTISPECIES: DJ-1/PfpI family protein [Bacillus cereus group]MCC2326689.1 DJ-1/PfpI family protein [Bacillus wiedmannii]MCU5500341.1 DJ-1/PfpI family protein [Bacillus wiedmannii]MDP1457622.1 DJ-1/PfpI family protein [Bacillus wiedmannii]MED2014807.1 DJ-1/PfpI family protein [Bacillus wiedmannii]MED3022749.1 DJ-1/PfpI family protein [Bacillus wiedmannii]